MLSWQETIIRLLLASILGALVGIERQRLDWAAGLRTHMLVCLGAALIMIVSAFGFKDVLTAPNIELDPSRIAAQVVSGIGFLGAGTILFLRNEVVRGLTTAAGLWTVGGIGLAVGGGLYFPAIATTVLVLIILIVVKPYKKKLVKHKKPAVILLKVNTEKANLKEIENSSRKFNLEYSQIIIQQTDKAGISTVQMQFKRNTSPESSIDILNELGRLEGVYEARFIKD